MPDTATGADVDLDISEYLQPGDTIVVGQAVAEPPTLVEKLIEAAPSIDDLSAICGYTLSKAWHNVTPGHPTIKAYAAHGALRKLGAGQLDVLPLHLSQISNNVAHGRLKVDVVLLQVGAADENGYYDLGATVDYGVLAAERARLVLVEVNANMPRTRSDVRLHRSKVTAELASSRPLAGSPIRPANDIELQVASNVASLVSDGAVIQLGASALAEAIAAELAKLRGLRVRSGLVGDWLVGLHEAGALDSAAGSVVTGMALGSQRLYDFLDRTDIVEFAPIGAQVGPTGTSAYSPFVSINSAIEVDVFGQLGSEVVGGRYVGAVGGQVDFFRAAQHSIGGLAMVALASTGPDGSSRIVPELSGGLVTSLKSDVDIVVTEWGVADIRTASLRERIDLLAQVAHPRHRDVLAAFRPRWL